MENTPWHKALFRSGIQGVKELIEMGMNPNNKDKTGKSALFIAAMYDNLPAIEYLMSLPNINKTILDNMGNTPLNIAAEKSGSNTVQFLMENGYSINHTNKAGWTPLFQAVLFKNNDVVRYLLSAGISPNIRTPKGNTPLHEGAKMGFDFIVRDLLASGADYSALNQQGNSPLFLSAENGHVDVVAQLHQKGDPGTNINYRQQSPLHVAIMNNHINVSRYLIDEMNLDIGEVDDLGRTPLDLAYMKGNDDLIAYLTQKYIEQQTAVTSTLAPGQNIRYVDPNAEIIIPEEIIIAEPEEIIEEYTAEYIYENEYADEYGDYYGDDYYDYY